MKISARGIIASVALLFSLALMSQVSAHSAVKQLKDQIVGHWQLVSVTFGGRTPYGASPQGSMFLDVDGHLSVIVISDGDARNISYFGTYTLDDATKSMTIHVDGSSGGTGNASGRSFKRLLQFQGDQLIVANEASAGASGVIKQTWKQAN